LRNRLPECVSLVPSLVAEWYEGLLIELGREVLPARANRVNPPVVQRKMSKFKKKGPEHRPVPPLKKTFDEPVVMLV